MTDLLQYYFFFAFIFFSLYYIKNCSLSSEAKKKKILSVVVCSLAILVGFRNVLYGRDTLGYVLDFKNTSVINLKETTEPGYHLLVCVLQLITSNYHVFLFTAYLSTPIALYKILEKYLTSEYEILASLCIYVLLGLLAFNMAAIRQTLAVSFGLFAFIYAADGKLLRFLVCVAIAYSFHNSAFVLLVLFPLRYINTKSYGLIFVGICFIIGVVASHLLIPFFQTYIPMEDRFAQYGTTYESSQNYVGFTLQFILVLLAFIKRNEIQLENKTKNLFFSVAYLGLAIQSLTATLAEFFRLSIYFCIFDIILIPLALSTFHGSNAKLMRTCFIIGCLVYILLLSGGGVLPHKEEFILPPGL